MDELDEVGDVVSLELDNIWSQQNNGHTKRQYSASGLAVVDRTL